MRLSIGSLRFLLLIVNVALVGCATELEDHSCPPGGTPLTYDNFGRAFFDANCNGCHGGLDAHTSRSFTSVDLIRAQSDRIFVTAAADNTSMPPGPDDPPAEERAKLADWLSCGAP